MEPVSSSKKNEKQCKPKPSYFDEFQHSAVKFGCVEDDSIDTNLSACTQAISSDEQFQPTEPYIVDEPSPSPSPSYSHIMTWKRENSSWNSSSTSKGEAPTTSIFRSNIIPTPPQMPQDLIPFCFPPGATEKFCLKCNSALHLRKECKVSSGLSKLIKKHYFEMHPENKTREIKRKNTKQMSTMEGRQKKYARNKDRLMRRAMEALPQASGNVEDDWEEAMNVEEDHFDWDQEPEGTWEDGNDFYGRNNNYD